MSENGWAVTAEHYESTVVQEMVETVQQEYVVRYGSRDDAVVDPDDFEPPLGLLLIARADGVPVAMGGFRDLTSEGEGIAEIKRMYVPTEHRRKGYSRRILNAIEDAARAAGYARVWLNTGDQQPEAIALYESSGYEAIGGFGHYADEAGAKFYAKRL